MEINRPDVAGENEVHASEKFKILPDPLKNEVLDFIDFLILKHKIKNNLLMENA